MRVGMGKVAGGGGPLESGGEPLAGGARSLREQAEEDGASLG